jgi:hypothetical protein
MKIDAWQQNQGNSTLLIYTPWSIVVPNMKSPRNPKDKRRFVEATQWLRPVTRWAARFSLNSPTWIPVFIRNTPLKLTALVLRTYNWAMR